MSSRLLFITNGHGEIAIADRIAQEVHALDGAIAIDHFPLVGDSRSAIMREVGPRRVMPSGGLLAMGNLRNIARDVSNGLLTLTFRQRRFLQRARGEYARVVAIGDVFALLMGAYGSRAADLRWNGQERARCAVWFFRTARAAPRGRDLRARRTDGAAAARARS